MAAWPSPAPAQRLKPEGDVIEATVLGLRAGATADDQAVVLQSREVPPREVEIWIGPSEAVAIQLRLEGRRYPRPLTHDLLETVLDKVRAQVVRVEVHFHSRHDATFVGRIHLQHAGKKHILDARASDSIAVALGSHAPIFLAGPVLKRAGRVAVPRELGRPSPPPTMKL